MNRRPFVGIGLLLLIGGPGLAEPEVRTLEMLSRTFTVDQKFRSMEGPFDRQPAPLLAGQEPELVWIVGLRSEIVGEDGRTPMPKEFMCHVNMDLDPVEHARLFRWKKAVSGRILTLSQGQFAVELPEGFGLPVLSDEMLELTTQVLNLNVEDPDYRIKHKISLDYVLDRELDEPLKPLFVLAPFGMKLLEGTDGYFGLRGEPDSSTQGPGCLPGEHAPNGSATGTFSDRGGRLFSGHWVVRPGIETNRTLVTHLMNLPFDTTVHYIAVHMHPFGETISLHDLTAGETVFTSRVTGPEEGIGIERVETYSSAEGIPLYRNHEYELVSVYNNTSGEDQDAMATLFLYALDHEFRRPRALR